MLEDIPIKAKGRIFAASFLTVSNLFCEIIRVFTPVNEDRLWLQASAADLSTKIRNYE
jgi:hypothetical protein